MNKLTRSVVMVIMAISILGTITSVVYAGAKEINRDDRFIAYDDGTVLDTKTNLMWAAKDNGSEITWSDARDYCEKYSAGGYSDWRMPKVEELESLYDASINRKFHLTKLIKLTWGAIWALEPATRGHRHYNFLKGNAGWGDVSIYRALPVRSAK